MPNINQILTSSTQVGLTAAENKGLTVMIVSDKEDCGKEQLPTKSLGCCLFQSASAKCYQMKCDNSSASLQKL